MGDDDSTPTIDRDKRERTDRFSKLEAMRCFGEVRKMLSHGVSTTRVAKIVQEEHGEYDDVKRASLERILRDYRSEEISVGEKAAKNLPSTFEDEIDEMGERLDVIDEMKELYRLQVDRVQMNVDKEQDMETLLKDTRKEIRTAQDLLESIADLKMEMGIEERNLGKLEIEASVADQAEDVMGEAMPSLTDPSKRNQLAEFVQRLDATDPEAVEAVIEESDGDGDVIDVEPEGDAQSIADDEEGGDAD